MAPEGPNLFSLAPRNQPPVLGLLAIGLEDRVGCSPEDVGTEVGYTATLFVATLDLGLDVVLFESSSEDCAIEPEPLGIPISSLLSIEGVGYLLSSNERAGSAGVMPILTTQATFAAVRAAS